MELRTQEAVQEVVDAYDSKFAIKYNDTTHHMRLYVEDGGTDVKLHHLPPKMPEEWIAEYLSSYGEIIHIKHEMCKSQLFPQTPSGVRVARVRMTAPIPSFINIKGYSSHCTYTNQIQTCRHCNQEVHFGASCAENRTKLSTQNKNMSLYSKVLAGGPVRERDPTDSAAGKAAQQQQPTSSIQHGSTSQHQAQSLFKCPAPILDTEPREKTVKITASTSDTQTTTDQHGTRTHKTSTSSVVTVSPRITPTNSRSNSLTRTEKSTMDISEDEHEIPDDTNHQRAPNI